jgi:hypothetical protein
MPATLTIGGKKPEDLSAEEKQKLTERWRMELRVSTAVWFECHGAITPKVGPVIKPPELRANYLQKLKSQVVEYCLRNNRPCRIISLKPRQKGSSTFSVATGYRYLCNMRATGAIIGGAHAQSSNLFRMLKTYAENDDFDARNPCKVFDREARWANGSIMEQLTAKNGEAGRSGTYQVVVATEVARWAKEGVANARDLLAGLLKCVANEPLTFIELDSTADGQSGDFYERWQDAITFEELKAGKDGFVKIFAAWFQFDDSRRDPRLEEGREQCVPPEKVESLRKEFGLDDWQITWMQWAVREECSKDFETFCEDYPFDAASAFRSSGRNRFNSGMLRKMVERSKIYPPELGVLETNKDSRTSWRPCGEDEALVLRWESPRSPLRYLVSVDIMKGATQVGGKDPDNHAALVWRAGYWDATRGWIAPKIVACLVHDWREWIRARKYQLIWDIDVLSERVWRLANYFGDCTIVVENNLDRGLIEDLKRRGALLYMQEQFNKREQKTQNAIGWNTTEATREKAVETLARGVREYGTPGDGCEIYCPITLHEMQNFVLKENGRSEANIGKHDDQVLAACIGLTVIESATTYSEPRVEVKLPWDLALLERESEQQSSGAAMRW